MFGKIKWLTLILPVLFLMTCTIGDDLESKKDPSTVSVTFDANGGSGSPPEPITGKVGDSIILPNANSLSKENHTFGGWNTSTEGTGTNYLSGASYILPSTNITLYAKWVDESIDTVTVTFNINGGKGTPPEPKTGKKGASITLPNAGSLSRENHTFGGWNTNAGGTGTNYSAGESFTMPNTDITLYAKWNDVSVGSVTVTFDANGGSGSPPAAQTGNIGASVTLPNANSLSKENHTFGGWNTNAGGTGINYPAGESFTLPNADITMYAKWDNVSSGKTTRTETKTFDSSSNWLLPGNVRYPATIEVYALGAGGGGQGGHRFEKWWVGDTNFTGTGAQGGGGAAAYTKFSVDNSIEFTVTVGRGGDGGSARFRKASITDNSWLSGMPGNSGGNTSVNVVGNITGVTTITAGGGSGGTGGGGNSTASGGAASAGNAGTGGSGGIAIGPNPNAGNSIAESLYVNGSYGRNGSINGTTISNDNAASINRGSFGRGTAGRGGSGGYGDTQAGGKGGDGRVIIVVTWEE